MVTRNKKKTQKLDLLEMPNPERSQLINEVREKLRKKVVEAKLWQLLLDVENLTINGNIVYREDLQISGFYSQHRI